VFSFDIKEIVFQRVEMKYGLKKSGHILWWLLLLR